MTLHRKKCVGNTAWHNNEGPLPSGHGYNWTVPVPVDQTRRCPVAVYNERVIAVNMLLKTAVIDYGLIYRKHKGLKQSRGETLLADGVHLTLHGSEKLYRSIRGACWAVVKWIHTCKVDSMCGQPV